MSLRNRNPEVSQRGITRRGLILGSGMAGIAAVLGYRMHFLQIDQSEQFRLLANENRINIRLIPPTRGRIFDRNGRIAADNIPNYRITIVREDAGDVDKVIYRLSRLIELDPHELEKARNDLKKRRADTPITLTDHASWEDISRVAVNAPALPGIVLEVGLTRHYPLGPDYAHLIGYVGPVSDNDLELVDAPDALLFIPQFHIGKIGVENMIEDTLRGKAGTSHIEVNAAGRSMRELSRVENKPGSDIQLTIDTNLQSYASARLEGHSAAAAVIDTNTGDILACVSSPSFDPNLFVRGISNSDYNALLNSKYRPLPNKPIQGIYPPGSTFKMVTALAALEDGKLGFTEKIHCPGHAEISGRRFHCWKSGGHGSVNLHRSLVESCDVFYYNISLRIGIEKIAKMARRLGLGERYDLPLTSVAKGLIPSKDWKLANRDDSWKIGDTVNSSIGQGYVLASPLQLAVMTARIASGRALKPRIIKSIDGKEQPVMPGEDIGIGKDSLKAIRMAMYETSNNRRGTAYGSRVIMDEFRLAGKTGTSQVRNISSAERKSDVIKNEDLPWEKRDHALFVSFAPYENPRIAIAVIVEHGGSGSRSAAPIARDIALQALYEDDPPLAAYPENVRDTIREQQRRLLEKTQMKRAIKGDGRA